MNRRAGQTAIVTDGAISIQGIAPCHAPKGAAVVGRGSDGDDAAR